MESPRFIEEYLAQPPRRLFDVLFEPFYDPFFGLDLPFSARVILVCLVILVATQRAKTPSHPSSRRARVKKRRSTMKSMLSRALGSMPLYTIVFAYIGTATSHTAVRSGFLKLPPKIVEADWFEEHCRSFMMALLATINMVDLLIVIFSILFSDTIVHKVVQYLNRGKGMHQKVELRSTAIVVSICQTILWIASYLCVALSAILLFATLLTWCVSGLPWIIYSNAFYPKLSKTWLGRYLNHEVQNYFEEHQFLHVADQFKTLVLPHAAVAFLTQINLMLCIWTLLLKTQERIGQYNLLRHLDLQLHLSYLFGRQRGAGVKLASAAGAVRGEGERIPSAELHDKLHAVLDQARLAIEERHDQVEKKEEGGEGFPADGVSNGHHEYAATPASTSPIPLSDPFTPKPPPPPLAQVPSKVKKRRRSRKS